MEKAIKPQKTHSFLRGGGEMGELTRTFDWSRSSLGTPDTWPQSLRTTISIILNSRFPMFLYWGPEFICFYNDAYRPSLGNNGKHPGILGMPGKDAWPEIWELIGPMNNEILNGGEANWFEDQSVPIYRNGRLEPAYWTFSHSPVLDDEGKRGGVLVNCTETTAKVINLTRLAESEEQLRFAIEATELGTWDYDPITNQFTGNQRLKEWFGLPPEDELDLKLAIAVIDKADRTRVTLAIEKALDFSSGGHYDIEYAIVHPHTNQRRNVRAKGKAWFNQDKLAYRFNGTLQDITEQYRSRKTLEVSEARFRSLIEEAPVATCLFVGRELKVEIANDTMLGYWGKDRSVIGMPLEQALPELKGQPFLGILDHVFTTGQTHVAKNAEAQLKTNGELGTYYFDYTYKPFLDSEGKVYAIMDMAEDVTDQVLARHQMAEVVAQRTKELAGANKTLQDINRELQRSNRNLEEFAHAASHDLKEPIRKIQFFTDLLKQQLTQQISEEQTQTFSRITNATQRMGALIDDLLLYSHASQHPLEKEAVNLTKKVSLVLEDLELDINAKKAVIHVEALPVVQGYRRQLQQLFQNLIGNAIKYSKAGTVPQINIRAERTEKNGRAYHLIEVADNGIGFAQEYAEKIFQMFARLHGKQEYGGTGVGLAIVRKIVENHEGIIEAESQIDVGSTFKVYLPAG